MRNKMVSILYFPAIRNTEGATNSLPKAEVTLHTARSDTEIRPPPNQLVLHDPKSSSTEMSDSEHYVAINRYSADYNGEDIGYGYTQRYVSLTPSPSESFSEDIGNNKAWFAPSKYSSFTISSSGKECRAADVDNDFSPEESKERLRQPDSRNQNNISPLIKYSPITDQAREIQRRYSKTSAQIQAEMEMPAAKQNGGLFCFDLSGPKQQVKQSNENLSKSQSNISNPAYKTETPPRDDKRYSRSKTSELSNSTMEKLKRLTSSKTCLTQILPGESIEPEMPKSSKSKSSYEDLTFTVETSYDHKPKGILAQPKRTSSEMNLDRNPYNSEPKSKEISPMQNALYNPFLPKANGQRLDQSLPASRPKPILKPVEYPFPISDEAKKTPMLPTGKGFPEVYTVPEAQVAPVRTSSTLNLLAPMQALAKPTNTLTLTPSKFSVTDGLAVKGNLNQPSSGQATKPLIIETAATKKQDLSSSSQDNEYRNSNEKSVSPVKDELKDIKELKEVISNIINKKEKELSHELTHLKVSKSGSAINEEGKSEDSGNASGQVSPSPKQKDSAESSKQKEGQQKPKEVIDDWKGKLESTESNKVDVKDATKESQKQQAEFYDATNELEKETKAGPEPKGDVNKAVEGAKDESQKDSKSLNSPEASNEKKTDTDEAKKPDPVPAVSANDSKEKSEEAKKPEVKESSVPKSKSGFLNSLYSKKFGINNNNNNNKESDSKKTQEPVSKTANKSGSSLFSKNKAPAELDPEAKEPKSDAGESATKEVEDSILSKPKSLLKNSLFAKKNSETPKEELKSTTESAVHAKTEEPKAVTEKRDTQPEEQEDRVAVNRSPRSKTARPTSRKPLPDELSQAMSPKEALANLKTNLKSTKTENSTTELPDNLKRSPSMPSLTAKLRSKSSPRETAQPAKPAPDSLISAKKNRLFGNAAQDLSSSNSLNKISKIKKNASEDKDESESKLKATKSSYAIADSKKPQETASTTDSSEQVSNSSDKKQAKPSILKKTTSAASLADSQKEKSAQALATAVTNKQSVANESKATDIKSSGKPAAKPVEDLSKKEPTTTASDSDSKQTEAPATEFEEPEPVLSTVVVLSPEKLAEISQRASAIQSALMPYKDILESLGKDIKQMSSLFMNLNGLIHSQQDDNIVKLNIGGATFQTYRATLTAKVFKYSGGAGGDCYEPHLLELLVTGATDVAYDQDGAIFVDKNSTYFSYVLDYLRNNASPNTFMFELPRKEEVLKGIINEASYFKMTGLVKSAKHLFKSMLIKNFRSSILNDEEKRTLIELCNLTDRLDLVYRATYHGFSAREFHSKCDGISRTLTIVKTTKGNVFGGYTEAAWSQAKSYSTDRNAYLFSLINKDPKDNKPLVMKCQQPERAIYNHPDHGPTFGCGYDFTVCSNSDQNENSLSYLCNTYKHPKWMKNSTEAKSYLGGSFHFKTVEIEVFSVE